jgi:hypothetical protein
MHPRIPLRLHRSQPLSDDDSSDEFWFSCASSGCSSCRSDLDEGDPARSAHAEARRTGRHTPPTPRPAAAD